MGYYKTIDGKKYDGELLDLAAKLTEGAKDQRISKDDAGQILEAVMDGDSYTDIEKDTVAYIRENYTWTDAADEWFRGEVRKWAAKK